MAVNCSDIVHEQAHHGMDDFDTLYAACENMIVNITKFIVLFKECCDKQSKLQLCRELSDLHLNMTIDLNCTNAFTPPNTFTPTVHREDYFDMMTYILMAVLLPLAVAGNLLILHAILRKKCLPIQTGYFLCSLAIADLGVIVEFIAFFIYHKNDGYVPERLHQYLLPSLDVFFGATSLLTITCISIERAIAVTWPLKYLSFVSKSRAKFTVLFVWMFSFGLLLLALLRIPISAKEYADFVFFTTIAVLLLLPMTVVVIAYSFVFVSAYQNLILERRRLKMLTILLRNDDDITDKDADKRLTLKTSSIRCKEIKLSLNVAMVVVPFLVCWGFFLSAHMYEVVSGKLFDDISNWFIMILPFAVSSMNPMLYLIFTRSLRNAVKSIIKRNVRRISRAELSTMTLSSSVGNGSRRASSIINNVAMCNNGRKIGRDFSYLMTSDTDRDQLVQNLNTVHEM